MVVEPELEVVLEEPEPEVEPEELEDDPELELESEPEAELESEPELEAWVGALPARVVVTVTSTGTALVVWTTDESVRVTTSVTQEVLVSVLVTTTGATGVELDWWCSEPPGTVKWGPAGAVVKRGAPGERVKEGRHPRLAVLDWAGRGEELRMGVELTGEDEGTTDDPAGALVVASALALAVLVAAAAVVAGLLEVAEAPVVAAAAPAVYRVGPGMS